MIGLDEVTGLFLASIRMIGLTTDFTRSCVEIGTVGSTVEDGMY